jgi:large subunit ribosomal protein L24
MTRIKKHDLVHVLTGKDKGKRGEVIEILLKKGKVKVKGVFLQTRHTKNSTAGGVGGVRTEEGFIDLSNVMPICKSTGKPCRVRIKQLEDGSKARVSHRSGEVL